MIYLLLIRVAVQTYLQESEAKTPPVLNQKITILRETEKIVFFSVPATQRERGGGRVRAWQLIKRIFWKL